LIWTFFHATFGFTCIGTFLAVKSRFGLYHFRSQRRRLTYSYRFLKTPQNVPIFRAGAAASGGADTCPTEMSRRCQRQPREDYGSLRVSHVNQWWIVLNDC